MDARQTTTTFLNTDIVGSTHLQETARAAFVDARSLCNRSASEIAARHNGRVFKDTGDGILAAFSEVGDALSCAIAIQQRMLQTHWPSDLPLTLRTAVYLGEAVDSGSDFHGTGVNRVCRLCAAANPGQILVGGAAGAVALAASNPPDLRLLGRHRLKDLLHEEEIYQLWAPGLPFDFGPLRTLTARHHNLPYHVTEFIGRRAELEMLSERLVKSRIITLVGTGGSGKTRLSQQLAAEVMESYADGVWFISLEGIARGADLLPAFAQVPALCEPTMPTDTAQLAARIADRSMLVILDNCEHVTTPARALVNALLRACPNLTILATSRERLQADGEVVRRVDPFSLPPAGAGIHRAQQSEAVQLFTAAAKRASQSFDLNRSNVTQVVEICRRLDGIPLALEIVAARMDALSLDQLLARLRSGRYPAAVGDPDDRRRTMDATLDWSYQLLAPRDAQLLRGLSVFSGGFTSMAAEMVCGRENDEPGEMEENLARLVGASLLVRDPRDDRYQMLVVVRNFAEKRLQKSGEAEKFRNRHLEWVLQEAEEAEPNLAGSGEKNWLDRLDLERSNIRQAITWATDRTDRLRIGAALHRFWMIRGDIREGYALLRNALMGPSAGVDPNLLKRARNALGILAWRLGHLDEARDCFDANVEQSREEGDIPALAKAANNLGILACAQREYEAGRAHFLQSRKAFEELGDELHAAQILVNLGTVACDLKDFAEAERLLLEAVRRNRKICNEWWVALAQSNLGKCYRDQGRNAEAREMLLSAADQFLSLEDWEEFGDALRKLVRVAAAEKCHQETQELMRTLQYFHHAGLLAEEQYDPGEQPLELLASELQALEPPDPSLSPETVAQQTLEVLKRHMSTMA
jgi:predicted ATPase/class 3 adenylate cyclase